MPNTYMTTQFIPVTAITLDGAQDAVLHDEGYAAVVTLSSINPAYPVDRSTNREAWARMYRILRKFDSDLRDGDTSRIGMRQRLSDDMQRASNALGYLGVYWAGTDCDGARWRRSYAWPTHQVYALEHELEQDAAWLDGPASYAFGMPTLRDVVYCAQEHGYRLPYRISKYDFAD